MFGETQRLPAFSAHPMARRQPTIHSGWCRWRSVYVAAIALGGAAGGALGATWRKREP